MRLDKFLTECGVGTRRQVKKLLENGEIYVNEKIIKKPEFVVKEDMDVISYKGKKLQYKKFRYYIMNKKAGYITATQDTKEQTVMELLPNWVITKNLVPIGRLDKDTEGLLLFTNDGIFAHSLLSPKKHVNKKYYVKLEKDITDRDIAKLETGVDIGNYITKPAKIEKLSEKEIYIIISEGKFHQVKKMLEAVKNKVIYLRRDEFGNIKLGNLKLGEVKEIDKEDIL